MSLSSLPIALKFAREGRVRVTIDGADLLQLVEQRQADAEAIGRAIVTLQAAVGYRPSGGARPDLERAIRELLAVHERLNDQVQAGPTARDQA